VPVGDRAFLVELGAAVDEAVNARILNLAQHLRAHPVLGIEDVVPTYRSLLVHFDPDRLTRAELQGRLKELLAQVDSHSPEGRLLQVPVVYGGEFGVDLEELADHHGLTAEEVIRCHLAATYRVYMVGFQPGFAYLGGLDPTLARSRRTEPRTRTPAGSVSIGGVQAAIASVEAPSGWHLIGRTPARLFMPQRDPPFLLGPGDRVRFARLPAAAWAAYDRRAAGGEPLIEAPA
jgi:5-oxoprolinase (ATP-hydrolysing) subunit B